LRHQIETLTEETTMLSTPETFLRAEADFRRERIRKHFAATARRRAARQARHLPAARRATAHVPGRLVTGS
jgi:hypothetical protein